MIDTPPDSAEDDVKKTIGFSGKKKQRTDRAEVATADVHESEHLEASNDSEKS